MTCVRPPNVCSLTAAMALLPFNLMLDFFQDGGPPTRHGVMRFFQKRLAGEKKADKPKISL
jgi:hypothetical protein